MRTRSFALVCACFFPVWALAATKAPPVAFEYTLEAVGPGIPSDLKIYSGVAINNSGDDYFYSSSYFEKFTYNDLDEEDAEYFGIEFFQESFVYAEGGAPHFYTGPDYYSYGDSKILYDIERSFGELRFNINGDFILNYNYYYSYYRFGGLFPFPEDQITDSIIYDSRTGGTRRRTISEFYDETTELDRGSFSLQMTRVTPVPAPLSLMSLALGVMALLMAHGRARAI